MITTLTGPNDFLRQLELTKQINEFVSRYGDIAVERLDGSEVSFEQLREAIQSLPFLTSRKLVILYTPGQQKQFNEQLAEIITDNSEVVEVVIVEPKLDKRSIYYKTLKKLTDFREFNETTGSDLVRWVISYAETQGAKISFSDANWLINRVGSGQLLLRSEIDKLALYSLDITRQSIELLTEQTPQSSLFELLDAALSGDLKQTTRLYREQRALKVEPQQIIAMLAWQLHILAIVKTAGTKGAAVIASEAGLSPFVVTKSLNLARHLSFEQLKLMVGEALGLDVRLKSEALDADEALQYYLLTLKA